jgi:hypothetical protein
MPNDDLAGLTEAQKKFVRVAEARVRRLVAETLAPLYKQVHGLDIRTNMATANIERIAEEAYLKGR